ncbi:MAG TPA: protein-disulfide reductase DsbD domain-containing protein [Candidatus Acidoferrum sp.]|nr:protein-disulfide reductase DsbD domain-containing protein [Candidatus Acidoferrum sp.]
MLVGLFCLAAITAFGANTQVRLILSAAAAKPGDTVWMGLDMKMDPGWHTYWKNPGAAGMATKIEWQLPPGVTAGDIQWPLPEKLPPLDVTTYGYNDEVVLLVPLKLAADLQPGPLELKAKVSWLECKEACLPGKSDVEATLPVGTETRLSGDAATIVSWQSQVPKISDGIAMRAGWESPRSGDLRPLILEASLESSVSPQITRADFFPDASDDFEVQGTTENLVTAPTEIRLRKLVKKFSGDWPGRMGGIIVLESGHTRTGFEVKFALADQAPAGEANPATSEHLPGKSPASESPGQPPETGRRPALPLMLLYAFIGGLILNIMPCVLPVIALKILGFVGEARSEPRHVRKLGLVYAMGVLVSFLVLAAVVIGVKAAGHHAGWGMQFGSPVFVVCLTTLVMLVALNLFGVFEVTLSGRALDAAGGWAAKHGSAGAFFNGVLATALATPCTAPFLSVALGFAFAQSASVILLVFLAVGTGLAAPYVILSWQPTWLKFLPKPGAWMEKFKIAMGFPMLATAVWLFNLAAGSYGKSTLWLGVFLVVVALAAWIFGEFVQRGRTRKGLALAIALILLVGGYAYALESQLHWRHPMAATDTAGSLKESANGIDWQRWTPEAVAQARAEGHPVLVDFTADWCLTCQVNKKTSIEIPSVRAKLKEINAVALLGDYTRFPDNITTELSRFNRAGVPLVLVYPKNPEAQPIVLPEILTPGIVLDALDRTSK